MTDRPLTYEQVWDQYASGKLSTVTLRQLLMRDEVFRRWCIRKAETEMRACKLKALPKGMSDEDMRQSMFGDAVERKARDIKAQQMISDEDMA